MLREKRFFSLKNLVAVYLFIVVVKKLLDGISGNGRKTNQLLNMCPFKNLFLKTTHAL